MKKKPTTGIDDLLARSTELNQEAEERRQASLKKGPLSPTQLALLEHLVAVAVRQKAEARATKTRFKRGWTHVNLNQFIRESTVRRLLDLGYAESCCREHTGLDLIKVTRAGVEHLESIRGEVILA